MGQPRALCNAASLAPTTRRRWSRWAAAEPPRRRAGSARQPCGGSGRTTATTWGSDVVSPRNVTVSHRNCQMNIEHLARVADLNARYADAIDADRLEAWPDFFLDDGRYRITTAENVAQGLPLSIIYATSRPMLRDRVTALREANVYEGQRYRHVLSTPLITAVEVGGLRARTSFIVARVMRTSDTMLFATGCYEDRVVLDASDGARFAEKTVVLDSRQIDTLLAIPL